jgi:transposase
MNAVGIDVSKGKSMVAILRPFGEIVASPFEVIHSESELSELAGKLKTLSGETKVIMECTSTYHLPVAHALYEAGLTVCAIHAQIIHNFGNNTIRKVKTDKADALKIANYGLTHWIQLPEFTLEDEIRHMLKVYSRQYNKYTHLKTMLKNNLISLADQTFPGVNELFTSPARKSDGHVKWVDFFSKFWHGECVSSLSQKAFTERYRKWCKKNGYDFSETKAGGIYVQSIEYSSIMPMNETTKILVTQATLQINAISECCAAIADKMKLLAAGLPEYPVVMAFDGVGDIIGPQLIAEIGNIYRFPRKQSLVCFAGLEAPPHQSGSFEAGSMSISKKGSPHLRKALFMVMSYLIKSSPESNQVYQFMNRKRAEGKHYYSYMTASSAKFLRIYYARVKEYLDKRQLSDNVLEI